MPAAIVFNRGVASPAPTETTPLPGTRNNKYIKARFPNERIWLRRRVMKSIIAASGGEFLGGLFAIEHEDSPAV